MEPSSSWFDAGPSFRSSRPMPCLWLPNWRSPPCWSLSLAKERGDDNWTFFGVMGTGGVRHFDRQTSGKWMKMRHDPVWATKFQAVGSVISDWNMDGCWGDAKKLAAEFWRHAEAAVKKCHNRCCHKLWQMQVQWAVVWKFTVANFERI